MGFVGEKLGAEQDERRGKRVNPQYDGQKKMPNKINMRAPKNEGGATYSKKPGRLWGATTPHATWVGERWGEGPFACHCETGEGGAAKWGVGKSPEN